MVRLHGLLKICCLNCIFPYFHSPFPPIQLSFLAIEIKMHQGVDVVLSTTSIHHLKVGRMNARLLSAII